MTAVRVDPSWLALREPADAAARSGDLVDQLCHEVPAGRALVIHDLACGTGAMLRWLAPRLPGPQHWVVHDMDAELLANLDAAPRPIAADGSVVTLELSHTDITGLSSAELAEAAVITASAVLDLMTADELRGLVHTCAAVRCPVLFTLTVTGTVTIDPPHPLDDAVARAFNAHQRRTVGGRALAGPDAAHLVADWFAKLDRTVVTRPSRWRLGPTAAALSRDWLVDRLAAACEHDPELAAQLDGYAAARSAEIEAGRLRVAVEHQDLLVGPAR